jgi:uncharacterized protein (TIRG00374 family)
MEHRKSHKWVIISKTLLGIFLLSALLFWNDNASELLGVISQFNLEYILALFAISLGLNAVSSIKWSLFLRDHGTDISQLRLLSLYLIGKFFNNFLPSMIGGDLARAYILGRQINSHTISAASVFLERVTGMIGLALLAGTFSIINYPILSNPIISISVATAIISCIAGVLLYYWPPFKPFFIKILSYVPFLKRFTHKIERLITAIEHFKTHYRLLILSLIYSVGFHILASINVYVACLSIGFEPDFIDILVITPVILMLTMIPVTPNNIGWWEWSFSVLLINAGASSAEGLAVALTLRAITLAVSLIGGILFLCQREKEISN